VPAGQYGLRVAVRVPTVGAVQGPHVFLAKRYKKQMHEYTINKCAEMLERDRASVARILRSVPPDAGTPSRPLYRLATVVRALIAHEAKPDGRRGNGDEARLAAERARLAREQTEAVALKNAAARFRASVPGRGSASAQIKPRTPSHAISVEPFGLTQSFRHRCRRSSASAG
jgi:hypothetical protein